MKKREEYFIETEEPPVFEKGFYFFYSEHGTPHRHMMPAHIHPSIEILFITAGEYRFYANNEEYRVKEGDILIFRSNMIHSGVTVDSLENGYYVLKVHPHFLFDTVADHMSASKVLPFLLDGNDLPCHYKKEDIVGTEKEYIVRRLIEEHTGFRYAKDTAMKIYVSALLLSILRDMVAEGGTRREEDNLSDHYVYHAIMYINRHFAEDISESECATAVGISRGYFSVLFRNATHKSFKEYLNGVRIAEAERRLLTSRMTISEIAADCGYNSVSYFISLYKKAKGETPFAVQKKALAVE